MYSFSRLCGSAGDGDIAEAGTPSTPRDLVRHNTASEDLPGPNGAASQRNYSITDVQDSTTGQHLSNGSRENADDSETSLGLDSGSRYASVGIHYHALEAALNNFQPRPQSRQATSPRPVDPFIAARIVRISSMAASLSARGFARWLFEAFTVKWHTKQGDQRAGTADRFHSSPPSTIRMELDQLSDDLDRCILFVEEDGDGRIAAAISALLRGIWARY